MSRLNFTSTRLSYANDKTFPQNSFIFIQVHSSSSRIFQTILSTPGPSTPDLYEMTPSAAVEVQALEAPLNDKARTALQDLARKYQTDRAYDEKLKQATELITQLTGGLNDRGYDLKQRHDKKLNRLAENKEEENEDEKKQFDDFQDRVAELTRKMDHSMRTTIDNRIWAQELPNTLRQVSDRAMNPSTQPTQQRDNEDSEDDTQPPPTVAPEETPSALLHAAISTNTTRWNDKSLTERYAHDNDYASFYKTMWDAQHPSETAPPLPAPALWFAREENPTAILSQPDADHNAAAPAEDDDLAVAAERVSLKCPITLQQFRDPVTSDACKHSFERTAIFDMLKMSTEHEPFTATQQQQLSQLSRNERHRHENKMRIKRVRCPDSGCRQFITESSLRSNPVLLRKVTRELEAQRRRDAQSSDVEDDDDGDELHGPSGTQRQPFGLDGIESSPPPPGAGRASGRVKGERVKSERRSGRMSVVPQTQMSPPSGTQRTTAEGATVVDLDDDDDA